MRFDRFTERAQDAAMRAYEIMQRYGHSQVDVEHLFLALLEQPKGLVAEIIERVVPAECDARSDPVYAALLSTQPLPAPGPAAEPATIEVTPTLPSG